jgi:hypothetical protein
MSSKTTSKSTKNQSTSSNFKLKQGSLFSFFNKKPHPNVLKSSGSTAIGPSVRSTPNKEAKTPDLELTTVAEDDINEFKGSVGQKVEVYWPDDDEWYKALISKQRGRQHFLEYDDGSSEWIGKLIAIFGPSVSLCCFRPIIS